MGLTTLDVINRAPAPPTANTKVTATAQWVAAGGPAANAAVTAAALGARAVLVSALGTGALAAAARADLAARGVIVLDCAPGEFQLAVSAILVDSTTGERSVVSPDAGGALVPGPTPAQLAELPGPDAVLFDGHHPKLSTTVLGWVDSVSVRPLVVLDCGRWRPVFAQLLPEADVAACSADFQPPPGQPLPTKVVITNGPNPVKYKQASGTGEIPVPQVAAVDTLGAGDAFHGALTVALAQGAHLPAAIKQAVAVASLRVPYAGPRTWLGHL